MPTRLNHCDPMRLSSERVSSLAALSKVRNAGGATGVCAGHPCCGWSTPADGIAGDVTAGALVEIDASTDAGAAGMGASASTTMPRACSSLFQP